MDKRKRRKLHPRRKRPEPLDLCDMEHERIVARVLGNPEPEYPALPAKTLLAAAPHNAPGKRGCGWSGI